MPLERRRRSARRHLLVAGILAAVVVGVWLNVLAESPTATSTPTATPTSTPTATPTATSTSKAAQAAAADNVLLARYGVDYAKDSLLSQELALPTDGTVTEVQFRQKSGGPSGYVVVIRDTSGRRLGHAEVTRASGGWLTATFDKGFRLSANVRFQLLYWSRPRGSFARAARGKDVVVSYQSSHQVAQPTNSASSSTPGTTTSATTVTSTSATGTVSVGSFPDATNTGSRGTLTVINGPLVLSTPGQVLTNVQVNGRVTVRAADVVLRNVKIISSDYWALMNYGDNLTVEDSTIIGTSNTQASIGDINSGNFTGRRLDLSGAPDGAKMGAGSKLYDSYIHDLASFRGAHNDGIELIAAIGAQVVHNTILNDQNQTSAVSVNNDSTTTQNILIENNLLAGGGYTVYGSNSAGASSIVVRGNAFSTRYFRQGGAWGPRAYWLSSGNTWSGNYWADGASKGAAVGG